MKRLITLLMFIPVLTFAHVPERRTEVEALKDSIAKLNARPVMTKEQFVKLYKYERLARYYRICKRKPTQWKYYKGWSIRVFEQ